METGVNLIEPLLDRVETYNTTSFELLKLKSLDKTVCLASTLPSPSMFALLVSFFAFTLNIAVALLLGDMWGKAYYEFLILASCYTLAGFFLLIIHPIIRPGK